LAFHTAGAEDVRIDSAGNVGIGNANPAQKLDVVTSGGPSVIRNTSYRAEAGQAALNLRFARGTVSSPTVVLDNDTIGVIDFYPYNGTNFNLQTVQIQAKVSGTVTANSIPTDIIFGTDAAGLAYESSKERMRINQFGVGIGGAIPSSGTGIRFPSTQSASSDANTLDDYEEGTWTPVDGSGAGLSFSNTSGNCFYTKVGRTVTVTFRLTYPSTASGSSAVVGGLPFLAIDTNVNVQAVYFGEQNFSAGAMGSVQDNNTTFLFLTTNGTSVTVHTNANVSGKDFRGTATYQAAS